jgi:RNA polymerase sigma-70 factor, ECF subfamily
MGKGMSVDEDPWGRMIGGLRRGDEAVVRDFCARYGEQLHRVAKKHLGTALRRRVGPEDIVQSACRSFLRRAHGGEFQIEDAEELWRLLCAITLAKVREHTRFHLRKKRDLGRERPSDAPPGRSRSAGFDTADPHPTPAEAAEFADLFETAFTSLDEEERRIVDLKLQELTNEEVAEQIGSSERTVRRLLKRVQGRLSRLLDEA